MIPSKHAKQIIRQFVVIMLIMFFIIMVYLIYKDINENKNLEHENVENASADEVNIDNHKIEKQSDSLNNMFYQLEQSGEFVNVSIETDQGKMIQPLEIYVYHVVSNWNIEDSLPEYVKVLCVLCRTEIIRVGLQQDTLLEISSTHLSSSYQYPFSRQAYPFENKRNEEIIKAVYATKGIIMTYDATPIFCPFFAVSAGSTRAVSTMKGLNNFSYLQARDCQDDYLAEDYLQKVSMSMQSFLDTLNRYLENTSDNSVINEDYANNMKSSVQITAIKKIKIIQFEKSNYVKQVVINDQDLVISGDDFRDWFGIASSAFSVQINQEARRQNEQVVMITKGVGHGVGLSLFHAKKMAEAGDGYQSILLYFFQTVKFDVYA